MTVTFKQPDEPAVKKRPIVIVDLQKLDTNREEAVAELMHAAEQVGFFQVKGHGIPQEDINAAFEINRQWLETPEEVRKRRQGATDNQAYVLGWSKEAMSEGTLRSGMLCQYGAAMEGLWPTEEECPGYKEKVLDFMHKCHAVTMKIMSGFALGLGLPEDYFQDPMDPVHPDCGTAIYNNRYPSCEPYFDQLPQGLLRIGAHTDFEVLTLLFQRLGQPGLEILPGKETDVATANHKDWTEVNPNEGCITINVGDALQYWSDDRLKSTYHRVRVPRPEEYKGDRYSMAYFANCRYSTVIQGPHKKYPALTFPEILNKKSQFNSEDKLTPEEREKLSPVEYFKRQQKMVLGPEFTVVTAASSA